MFFTAAVNIIVNSMVIPVWGIFGAAVASVVSYNISGLLFIRYFCKNTRADFKDMILIKKSDIAKIKKMLLPGSKN